MRPIDSPERMIEVIREHGIIPFFRCGVPGWSIEEMTAPGCWFTDEEIEGLQERISKPKSPEFIIIDSVQAMGIGSRQS